MKVGITLCNLSMMIPSSTILGDLTEDPGLFFHKVGMMHKLHNLIHILTNIHFHEVLVNEFSASAEVHQNGT